MPRGPVGLFVTASISSSLPTGTERQARRAKEKQLARNAELATVSLPDAAVASMGVATRAGTACRVSHSLLTSKSGPFSDCVGIPRRAGRQRGMLQTWGGRCHSSVVGLVYKFDRPLAAGWHTDSSPRGSVGSPAAAAPSCSLTRPFSCACRLSQCGRAAAGASATACGDETRDST